METLSQANEGSIMDKLEREVDRMGIKVVLSCLSDVCTLKSQHISENWQDEDLAKSWAKLGNMIHKAYASVDRLGIS